MSKIVLLGLVVVWGIYLAQEILPRLARGRRGNSMVSFRSGLSSLERSHGVIGGNVIDLGARRASSRVGLAAGPAAASRPATPSPSTRHMAPSRQAMPTRGAHGPRPVSPAMRKRRQDVLVSLVAAAAVTLLAAIAFGGPLLYLHLVADVLLVAYLGALVAVGATAASTPARSSHPTRRGQAMPAARAVGVSTAEVLAPRPIEARRLAN